MEVAPRVGGGELHGGVREGLLEEERDGARTVRRLCVRRNKESQTACGLVATSRVLQLMRGQHVGRGTRTMCAAWRWGKELAPFLVCASQTDMSLRGKEWPQGAG